VLVLHGEAGIGKTALLEYVALHSSGCRIVRASGAESEMELPFGGLHQLCARMLDRLDRLPDPQREALSTAFGLSTGKPPDRFIVGLAVLSLLSDVAGEQPLICLVDDAQWFDRVSAQTLAFVARRLLAEPIAMVFAVRDLAGNDGLSALPQLMVGGLHDGDARALLDSVLPGRMDDRVRDRIVAETHGNPLALLELPRGLTVTELAGGFGRPDARPLAGKIERSFAQRVRALPTETQRFLLTAAAEPVGDATLLLRATRQLGIAADAAAPAVAAGLIEPGARVRFRHPLVRSATYRAATPAQRREVHQALADATDPAVDPDRRAWHRAHAVDDADEEVAADLVYSADRAQRRGGVAAAAEFLHRATELTPDPRTRAMRALASAQAQLQSGAFEAALKMLITAGEGASDELHLARVSLLRAQIAFASGPDTEAPRLLLEAARRLEPLDTELARDTYRDALGAAIVTGGLAEGAGVLEVVRAVQAAPRPAQPRAGDLLLDALAVAFTDGYAAAVPLARETLRAFRAQGAFDASDQPWLWLATIVAANYWDDESWSVLTSSHARIARDIGDLSQLPISLNGLVVVNLAWGERAAAAALVEEIQTIAEVTGAGLAPYGALALAAWGGNEAKAVPLIAATMADVVARGEESGLLVTRWAQALLMNGLGRYEDALRAARAAAERPIESGPTFWSLAELIESAIRIGRTDLAESAYARLAATTHAAGTDWALGLLARSGALLEDGSTAEDLYLEAIDRLGRTRLRMELARAQLLYGEWLRRDGRRQQARAVLTSAHETFTAAGAGAFAARARSELHATGAVVPERTTATHVALTAQEAHIARLASEGLTNPEIGTRLFLSPHTVEWHLRKVFAKLGITSRRQLPATLGDDATAGLA
jgi:DNA-binding CsgD family transcriptional regulator/tetratricopeptide (TPR) repeat protein